MLKTITYYGCLMALLFVILESLDHFLKYNTDVYTGLIALIFLGFGVFLTKAKKNRLSPEKSVQNDFFSKRENEVLELLALGLSNQEIADQLFVSTNTIKTHLRKIYEKMDVSNRTQALLKWQANKTLR